MAGSVPFPLFPPCEDNKDGSTLVMFVYSAFMAPYHPWGSNESLCNGIWVRERSHKEVISKLSRPSPSLKEIAMGGGEILYLRAEDLGM